MLEEAQTDSVETGTHVGRGLGDAALLVDRAGLLGRTRESLLNLSGDGFLGPKRLRACSWRLVRITCQASGLDSETHRA